ncbi:alpha-1,6-mannosylglycoprotein 6-beta-N-acetylglucosaminyltransferase A-like [Porites lutea]|uniref:alpha-1,6-mannosylglycoprotein 6-beta-N-acetylglucosaminyltransferase A-like n=1 Tax=Porites lutea TaxID=51062 RepID=UPI003CC5DA38
MRSRRRLIANLAVWILVMYLLIQCGIFVYKLEDRSVTEEIGFVPNERTNNLPKLFQNRAQVPLNNCSIPDDWLYPLCKYKIEWMKQIWSKNRECYVNQHGVDPKDNCNLLIYFSEVEKWCPTLPWRRHFYPFKKHSNKLLHVRDDLTGLMHKLNESKYQFMRDRITRLWPEWRAAAERLEQQKPSFGNRQRKNILLFMGAFAFFTKWLEKAYDGVSLGEMVQWSDLIASMYVLGHNITLSAEQDTINRLLDANAKKRLCATRLVHKPFDLIYTDYIGTTCLDNKLGASRSHFRCNLRILDSFGTDAEFNCPEYKVLHKSLKSSWGGQDVHLRQIMTMFPHSPDNLFLGFVVDKALAVEENRLNSFKQTTNISSSKPIGLLYAKKAAYLRGRRKYIDVLSKYLEIHGTIAGNGSEDYKALVPDYVINHGIMKGGDLQKLLRTAKVFIGLGFPYEGPAPLEAISQACVFINPKFDPPHSRSNTGFFKSKPTFREVTSQHPYMETFIGKPHVYTIDVNNLNLVEATIKEIISLEVKPFLPYEWTPGGMLERLNAFVEKMDFCEHGEQWPPTEEMHLLLGSKGDSCKETCARNGMT